MSRAERLSVTRRQVSTYLSEDQHARLCALQKRFANADVGAPSIASMLRHGVDLALSSLELRAQALEALDAPLDPKVLRRA